MTYIKKIKSSFNALIDDIAPDKSISHRAVLFSLLSDKTSKIENFLKAEDTLNTLKIAKKLGAKARFKDNILYIKPPKKIKEPKDVLNCGNSGTAMRLLMGFLAFQKGSYVLHGDKYLANRPMKRVAYPLKQIGARVDGRENANLSPIHIRGKKLKSFNYESPVASAQVKSAMILAGLKLKKKSTLREPFLSRDHSENMLNGMGAKIQASKEKITINPLKKPLNPLNISIPADPSSGFFFAVLVALVPNSSIVLKNMLLNKTRIEAYEVLRKMGLDISYKLHDEKYEKIGDISIKHAPLKAIKIDKNIPWLIDEIPALAIAFSIAKGTSEVRNAKELRVKESDRINSVVSNLKKCGIQTQEFEDGFSIKGGEIKSAKIQSYGDHRIAMSFIIAGLKSSMSIDDIECIKTSFPNFFDIIEKIKSSCK